MGTRPWWYWVNKPLAWFCFSPPPCSAGRSLIQKTPKNIKQLDWARTNWMLDMRKLLGFSIGVQIFLTPSNKGIAKGIQLYNTAGVGPCKFYCLFTLWKLQNGLDKRTNRKPQRSFFLIKRKQKRTKFHLPCWHLKVCHTIFKNPNNILFSFLFGFVSRLNDWSRSWKEKFSFHPP